MRYLRIVGISAAIVAILCGLAYAEFVLDWRTGRSEFAFSQALGVNVSVSLVPYNRLVEEMKKKYGDRAKVSFEYPPGRTTVELDGSIIYDSNQAKKFADVTGLFAIGRRGAVDALFPFRIAPDQDPARIDRHLAEGLRNRFGKAGFPQRLLSFTDSDWSMDRCVRLPTGLGLGKVGEWLRLRKGAACVVSWRGPHPASMLVSVSVADGDPWLRPFSRRLCRSITETALAQVDSQAGDAPAFAACVLADRPTRNGADKALSSHAYSVGPSHRLALMD